MSKKNTDQASSVSWQLEDEYVPTLEEYVTHLESLEGEDALELNLKL